MPTVQNPRYPDWLDRRASNAMLIAASRAAIARGQRLVETSEQLMRVSARLMPRSPLDAPPPQPSTREWQAVADNLAHERRETEALRQIGYVLRSCAEEMIVTSQELRWQACQTRMQARVEWARAQQVRSRTRKTAGEATYPGDRRWVE